MRDNLIKIMKFHSSSILLLLNLWYTFGFQINYWKNIGSFCANHHYKFITIYNNFNDSVYITAQKYAQIKLRLFDQGQKCHSYIRYR